MITERAVHNARHSTGCAGIFSAPAPQQVEQLHLLEMITERVIYPRDGSAG
jgi:hypothetical protein